MKKLLILSLLVLLLTFSITAQKNELITVKAGMTVKSCFPPSIRYRYAQFTDGSGYLKNGTIIHDRFNYNFLLGEMDFIRSKDTLTILNKKDIKFMTIAQDTFYFNNGYLEQIRSGNPKVFVKETIALKDILKKGALGTTARGSSVDQYTRAPLGGNVYELVPDADWVFQKTSEYFLLSSDGRFIPYIRKNAIQLLPGKEVDVKDFIKKNRISFESREDLLKLAEYLSSLSNSRP